MAETISNSEIRDLLLQFKSELFEFLKKFELKQLPAPPVFPQITNPESGETIPNHANQIHVDVRSNEPPTLIIQLYTVQGQPVGNPCTVQLTQNGSKFTGHADLNKPAPGDYVIYCYVQGDNPMNPTHHVDRIFIKVSS
jgi:hypothetical protein